MKNSILLILLMTINSLVAQENVKSIFGTVTDGANPIANVEIKNSINTEQVFTDAEGKYVLKVPVGTIIFYSYAGMASINILVEDVTRVLNVQLFPDIEELDEVVVTESRRKSKEDLEIEYSTNPELIRSAYGILDPSTSAYQIRVLAEGQFSEVGLCILGVLRGNFPGVTVVGDCIQGGFISIRGSSSFNNDANAIYDVDGQIFNDAPVWLPVSNMKRIAVISGLAARNLYGGIASGGVVIINTTTRNAYATSKEIKDKARLRNNVYKGEALSVEDLAQNEPKYVQELRNSNTLELAKEVYDRYAKQYSNSYSYFVDVAHFFKSKYPDAGFEENIIDESVSFFEDNPVALKAFAYQVQTNEDFKKANEIYQNIFIHRPNYAQSYMDLANSYREVGNYSKAASLYARYDYLVEEGFLIRDSTAFSRIIGREYSNLLALNGKQIFSKPFKAPSFDEGSVGTRLVFEWNDSEAEFELQFVNPEKHYFKTEHSLMADASRIRDEKLLGYSCEEFLIDDSLPGTWQVNVKYLGNKSLTPTYLKVTIYRDYGTAKQQKATKVYKLRLRNQNQELFKINTASKLIFD